MDSRVSRSEYERRMHRVVETIDRQLDQPLDLQTLATKGSTYDPQTGVFDCEICIPVVPL
jgi:hypothetical protein